MGDKGNVDEVKESVSSEETANCPICDKDVCETDNAIQCETCMNWFHIKCQDVSQKKYKFLMSKDGQGLHWFCKICEAATLGLIKVVSHLVERINILEEIIEKNQDKLEGIKIC